MTLDRDVCEAVTDVGFKGPQQIKARWGRGIDSCGQGVGLGEAELTAVKGATGYTRDALPRRSVSRPQPLAC